MSAIREAKIEEELYHLIKTVLKRHHYRIEGVNLGDVEPQYSVDGGVADLVLPLSDGKPLLEIECKRKVGTAERFMEIRSFDPLGSKVIDQALFYAVKLGTPLFATTHGGIFALFRTPKLGEPFKMGTHRLLVKDPFSLKEGDVEEVLRLVAQWYAGVPIRPIEIDWLFIARLRSFVRFISDQLLPAVKKLKKDDAFLQRFRDFSEKVGGISIEQLAGEASYLLMNKIVFYKILERHYHDLPKLKPISAPDGSAYASVLRSYFEKAIEVTRDFEPVFVTGIYDDIPLPSYDYFLEEVNSFIDEMEKYRLEEVGSDVVGHIYEELIPAEERHRLGQFYTPPPIAELIVRWALRRQSDLVLDPAVGSGTFLLKAYKRLGKLKQEYFQEKGLRRGVGEIHREVLSQLYAIDVNPFPAHLTAMNLAMREVKFPTSEMNVIVEDFFNLRPKYKALAPFVIKTPAGEVRREIILPEVDAVVANPPYTRWVEIPEETRDAIGKAVGIKLRNYGLSGGITREMGVYIPFIVYGAEYLKKGGRLGMIISNSWLQADYGVRFVKYLLDNFKVKAVIDFSSRLFRVPLIATCVILLEKETNKKARSSNKTVFMYIDKEVDTKEIIDALSKPEVSKGSFLINVVSQADLPRDEKWVKMMFRTQKIEQAIRSSPDIVEARKYFDIRYGNVKGVFARGGTGGNVFFYLTDGGVEKWGLQRFVYPLLCSSRYSKFFSFTKKDWDELREKDRVSHVFVAHKPRNALPQNVKDYIKYGSTTLRTRAGKTCNKSMSSLMRERNPKSFCGWYDLGGVLSIPFFGTRYSQYKHRFTFTDFQLAVDEDFIAFIPKESLKEHEIKALLAYLNSSITDFLIEIQGRTTGGGMSTLEPNLAMALPVLDVKKLDVGEVEALGSLFDKLEAEARRLGGADTQDGLEKLQPTINKIDESIAEVLGLKKELVKNLRSIVKILSERRISRAFGARPESIRGEEAPKFKPPRKLKRGKAKEVVLGKRLDIFFEEPHD